MEAALRKVQDLQHEASCVINWHEDGGGLVYRLWDAFVLFEVPQYGGEPRYAGTFTLNRLNELVSTAYSWT